MLAAISTERYSAGRDDDDRRRAAQAARRALRHAGRPGAGRAAAPASGRSGARRAARSASSWPSSRSKVTTRPRISIACARIVPSSDTGTSADHQHAARRWRSRSGRAKYSARSEVAKLTTGALIASCGAVCASASAAKPLGSGTPMRWLSGLRRGQHRAVGRPARRRRAPAGCGCVSSQQQLRWRAVRRAMPSGCAVGRSSARCRPAARRRRSACG